MAFPRPASFDDCEFYTKRAIGEGKVEAFAVKAEPSTVMVNYTCPRCKKEDSVKIPYEIKSVGIKDEKGKRKSVKAFVFECSCGEKIIMEKWAKRRGPK